MADAESIKTLSERFWSKVSKEADGCWLWQSSLDKDGYGHWGPSINKRIFHFKCHRFSWMATHGPIPSGLSVLHKCDVRRCVNPNHLFLGTQSDNLRDAESKGRMRRGTNPNPANRGSSKLTAEQVVAIKTRYATGDVSQQELADSYGVSQGCISWAVRGKTWTRKIQELLK